MKQKPLRCYVPIPREPFYNASFYYRLEVPFTTMEDAGLPVETIFDRGDRDIDVLQRLSVIGQSDIVMLYQPAVASILEDMRRYAAYGLGNFEDQWLAPPSFVVNTDDNLFMVHPKNHAFQGLGIRMPDGRLLSPSAEIGEMDEQNVPKVLWRGLDQVAPGETKTLRELGCKPGQVLVDGSRCMDVPANMRKLTIYRDILNAADSVVCSTPRTEKYVREEASPRSTFVSPNMVRLDHYEQVDLAPHPDEIRILWQGSTTHFEDFMDLTEVLPTVLKQYPQAKFIFWGSPMPWIMKNIPTDRYKFIPWCKYEEYKLRLMMIGHDIAIAPLRPHRFNMCRSAIKFYESTVAKKPAAFLGQNSGPYADEIIDGQTGMLWNTPYEFGQMLGELIENRTKREELAANGKQWVRENRDAMKLVKPLYDYLRSIRAERERTLKMPPDWRTGYEGLKREVEAVIGSEEVRPEEVAAV